MHNCKKHLLVKRFREGKKRKKEIEFDGEGAAT